MVKTIYRQDSDIVILDQSRLPNSVEYLVLKSPADVADAIKKLKVRGAPLIGVTAAMGMALGISRFESGDLDALVDDLYQLFRNTRPTAVNLFWALERMKKTYLMAKDLSLPELKARMWHEAEAMAQEDYEVNLQIGVNGAALLQPKSRILTICNAGALATCGHGTALGIVRSSFAQGKVDMVYACETRPVLQGARLTVWELMEDGIPTTLITDNMAAYLMQLGRVDVVIAGADRIAANGDTANKIGTYMLAVSAKYHGLPFLVAAPTSTIDASISKGSEIPIEEREGDEVRRWGDNVLTVPDVPVFNPAFDVTPNHLISAIVTEKGVFKPPYDFSNL